MIKVPEGSKIVDAPELTAIRVLSTLCEKDGWLDQRKGALKKRLRAEGEKFAASDLVIARLADAQPRRFADPLKLYEMVKTKRITIEQFLGVLCVRTSLLPEILSGVEIDAISRPADNAKDGDDLGALYTEFKTGIELEPEALEKALLVAIESGWAVKEPSSKAATSPAGEGGKSSGREKSKRGGKPTGPAKGKRSRGLVRQ